MKPAAPRRPRSAGQARGRVLGGGRTRPAGWQSASPEGGWKATESDLTFRAVQRWVEGCFTKQKVSSHSFYYLLNGSQDGDTMMSKSRHGLSFQSLWPRGGFRHKSRLPDLETADGMC